MLNGKQINDSIAYFEIFTNELKSFHSVLLHYKVTSEYFSGEVVKEILDRRLSKNTCKEFTNFKNIRGFTNDTTDYLHKLTKWINQKIFFGKLTWVVTFYKIIHEIPV